MTSFHIKNLFFLVAVFGFAMILGLPDRVIFAATTTPSTTTPEALVSFDFDDGFESAYKLALPIVNAAGFKATEYIITHKFTVKGYVTGEQVLDMQAKGNEIGAHTRTHPHIARLSDIDAWDQIEGSKEDLLNLGVTSVNTFAYPYGEVGSTTEVLVKNAGFIAARR